MRAGLAWTAVAGLALCGSLGAGVAHASGLAVGTSQLSASTTQACSTSALTVTKTAPVVLGLFGYGGVQLTVPSACAGAAVSVTVYATSGAGGPRDRRHGDLPPRGPSSSARLPPTEAGSSPQHRSPSRRTAGPSPRRSEPQTTLFPTYLHRETSMTRLRPTRRVLALAVAVVAVAGTLARRRPPSSSVNGRTLQAGVGAVSRLPAGQPGDQGQLHEHVLHLGAYRTTAVTFSNVDVACHGLKYRLQVLDTSGAPIDVNGSTAGTDLGGTVTLASDALTVSSPPPPRRASAGSLWSSTADDGRRKRGGASAATTRGSEPAGGRRRRARARQCLGPERRFVVPRRQRHDLAVQRDRGRDGSRSHRRPGAEIPPTVASPSRCPPGAQVLARCR